MRILHLAYEDPAQPGSGGGSVRTREIDGRLARRHEVTAVVAGYPGARARLEDGVRWVPLGTRTGGWLDKLSYFALLGAAVRRSPHDLVVEDFGAPFSTGGAPLHTRAPVVASVQWLFAREMRAKYRLPFDWVERAGLRLYDEFIAVSDWLAAALRARRPQARIVTIPNGVEALAFRAGPLPAGHLLFVGRLDRAQKGCDLLLEAYARARAALGPQAPPLVIAGDGPDRAALERQAGALGLAGVVDFRGRVEGAAKYDLMAAAHALLMPSRFETFGLVAVEGQAAGAPVVAFAVGPLAEVAGGGGARLVPPHDLDAFAAEIVALVRDPARRAELAAAGRQWATRYNWDALAARQEEHYADVLAAAAGRERRPGAGAAGPRRTPG
jgi:glycosyltransferase involved in cell wall biosynthesis